MPLIQTDGVIGGGTMGNGIAHVAARSGFKVVLHDLEKHFLDRAMATIARNLDREVAKGKSSKDHSSAALSRIATSVDYAPLAEADFLIEAVSEDLGIKSRVLQALDEVARPNAILASNTSSISITKLGSKTKRPDKVIGMHFMNPVP